VPGGGGWPGGGVAGWRDKPLPDRAAAAYPAAVPEDPEFARLLAEGEAVPVEGWDFSWFDGRATEERPSWGYARMMAGRMAQARAALDIQTGGGEVLASIPQPPPILAATESWPPNAGLARRNLAPLGARVVQVADERRAAVRRGILRPRGEQAPGQAGVAGDRPRAPPRRHLLVPADRGGHEPGAHRLHDGPAASQRGPRRGPGPVAGRGAGLVVTDLREEALRTVFNDVGAVVYFLRKVLWTVPGFICGRVPAPAAPAARGDPVRRAVRGARPAGPDRGAQAQLTVAA